MSEHEDKQPKPEVFKIQIDKMNYEVDHPIVTGRELF